jgi:nucleotide-binding universal stress UspA family protein
MAELWRVRGSDATSPLLMKIPLLRYGEDPATIVSFEVEQMVDHIVVGARASSSLRRYLGSVSSRVVAEAPCTVTVVRAR